MVTLLFFATPVKSQAPIGNDLTSKEGIQSYISIEAQTQGVPPEVVEKVIECESQYVINAIGDNGKAHGIAQFHEETFYRMQRLSGLDLSAKWGDARAEIDILTWALHTKNDHGILYASEWSCWKK